MAGTGKLPGYLDFCSCDSHKKSEQQHLHPGQSDGLSRKAFCRRQLETHQQVKMADMDEQTNSPQCFDFSACCSGHGALVSFDHGCSPMGETLDCRGTSGRPNDLLEATSLKRYSTLVTRSQSAVDGCNTGPQNVVASDGFLESNDDGFTSHNAQWSGLATLHAAS